MRLLIFCSLFAMLTACASRSDSHQQSSPVDVPHTSTATPIAASAPADAPTSGSIYASTETQARPTPAPTIISPALVRTRRISSPGDNTASGGDALTANMSVDGRYIVFSTDADNLSPNDSNGYSDVYLFDRESGDLRLISANESGQSGDSWSGGEAVSIDGTIVAFYSWAGDLTEGDINSVQDLFVYDSESGEMGQITHSVDGGPANDRSGDSAATTRPAMSMDGRIVTFQSMATNLVDGDTNRYADVFVYNRSHDSIELISLATNGSQGNGPSVQPALSADGRYVAYSSQATNLDNRYDANDVVSQTYLHDRIERTTTLMSVSTDHIAGNDDSISTTISGDGQTLVFESDADNLVSDDVNRSRDVFAHDVRTGETELVSVNRAGTQGNGDSYAASISLDGRYVVYLSDATNLVDADNNGYTDVFVYDRLAKRVQRVSVGVLEPGIAVEANGPSFGAPVVSAGGDVVAYTSYATNIVADGDAQLASPVRAEVYVVELTGLPTYTVSGRVLDGKNQPIADVQISAGTHDSVTDADGRWSLLYMPPGVYTVQATHEDVRFANARQVVQASSDVDGIDFTGSVLDGQQLPFLSFPLGSMSVPEMLQALGDLDEGGWVDAWFDHDAPDYRKNAEVILWDGQARTYEPYNSELGCYERRCYDGHDGTDFPYRDPNPETRIYEPLVVRAAADGTIAHVVDGCQAGDRWCNGGYGNEAVILHNNGYYTRYAHLAHSENGYAPAVGASIRQGVQLGVMGNSGNSYGVHLHFAVHQDNGNGAWDGEDVDHAADPFGWAGEFADPWSARATSYWMWNEHPTVTQLLFGSHGGEIRDQADELSVEMPASAVSGQVRLELDPGAPVASPQYGLRRIGQPFELRVIDWYPPDGASVKSSRLDELTLNKPLTITFALDENKLAHIDVDKSSVVGWESASEQWQPLPTEVDLDKLQVVGQSDRFGRFDLQAPLICPEDAYEPDDAYYSAVFLPSGDDALRRLFDVADDADWFRLDGIGGEELKIAVESLGDDTAVDVDFVGGDGLTALGHASSQPNSALEMIFIPPSDGTYFIRLAPQAGSSTGCNATYTIAVQ